MAATAGVVIAGPWGGEDGSAWNFRLNVGERLTKITVCSSRVNGVYSIKFSYVDINNILRESLVFGGPGGDADEISLAENEFITGISGTFGRYYDTHIILASMSFTSNLHSYGPYGNSNGTNFSLPVSGGNIVGYFGKKGDRLDSIGVMLKSEE